MSTGTNSSREKEKRYAWDKEENREILILRRMMYDDPGEILHDYDRKLLKKIYIEQWFKMDRRNQSFWKFILEVDDNELDRDKKELRTSLEIWDY